MLTSFLFVVEELQKKLKKDTEEFFLPPLQTISARQKGVQENIIEKLGPNIYCS